MELIDEEFDLPGIVQVIAELTQSINSNNYKPLINPFSNIIKITESTNQNLKNFSQVFMNLCSIWPQLFLEERICSPDRSIDLGQHINVFLHEAQMRFGQNRIYQKIVQFNTKCLFQYIKAITLQFIHTFSQSKQILHSKVRQLNTWAEKLKYTNKYLMFKVLKELSMSCYKDVKSLAVNVEQFITPQMFQNFVKWMIQKHELLELKLKIEIDNWKIKSQTQKETTQEFQVRLLKYLESIKHKQNRLNFIDAIRDDGKRGLLIIQHFENDLDQQYLVFSNEFGVFTVMNSALITRHWRSKLRTIDLNTLHEKQKNQLQKILIRKEEIISQMRTAPTSVTKIYMEGIENVGDSLGKCIANFKNYKSIDSFIKDFSKKTAIAGSISYMVLKIPLLGGLMIVGGFSYTLYNILSNDYKNNNNKLADIGKLTIKTSASIGGGLVGAAIGQTLIPIPFVGAFIGGVFGGFLSTIGSQKAFTFLSNKRAQSIYYKLKSSINDNGSWTYTEQLLSLFGLKVDYFEKTIPLSLPPPPQNKTIWITGLCFCVLSYYESKKDKIEMEEQLKKKSKLEIKEELDKIKEVENEHGGEKVNEFVSQDLDRTILYMEQKGVEMREHMEVLVSLMMKLVQQQ